MKLILKNEKTFIILIISLVLCFVIGCGKTQEDKQWEKAVHDSTGNLMREYIAQYPKGKYANACKIQIEYRDYSKTNKSGTLEACLEFLDKYPKSAYTSRIKIQLRNLLFAGNNFNSIEDDPRLILKKYLTLKPDGEYAAQAIAAIDNLYWLETCLINIYEAYSNYVNTLPNGMYYAEACKKLKKIDVEKLYHGMTPSEVEEVLDKPDEKEPMYSGVNGISRYGKFYDMKYLNGISCSVRKTYEFEKVFNFSFNEDFASSYRGVHMGMTKEEVIDILGEPSKTNAGNEFTLFYHDEDKKNSKSGLYINLCRYENAAEYGDLSVSVKDPFQTCIIKHNNGILHLEPHSASVVLSGKKLYIKKNFTKNRVVEISHTDCDLRGNFYVLYTPK